MRFPLAVALAMVGLAGCERAEQTGRVGQAVDTVVTTRQTQDTTIVTRDTTVRVDTTVKEGDRATRTDTVEKTGGATRPAAPDTGPGR